MIDKRLLHRLFSWLPPIAVGRAIDKHGRIIETHATMYAESVVEHRHYPPRQITPCPGCGTIRTSNSSTEPVYLLDYDIGGQPAVMDRIGSIYVSEDVAKAVDLRDLKPLYLQEIEVTDRPRDGLRYPTDPPWVRGVDARQPWDAKKGAPWEQLPRIGGDGPAPPVEGDKRPRRDDRKRPTTPRRVRKYYQLQQPEHRGCPPSPEWLREQIKEGLLCTVCERIAPGWFPKPIDVEYLRFESYHLLEPSQTNIALIDRRVLERLRPYLPPVAVGRALDGAGAVIETHATIYPMTFSTRLDDPPPVVTLRDEPPHREIMPCIECGTIRVARGSAEPPYLLSYEIADRPIVFDRTGCVYMSEDVAMSIDLSDLKPLGLQEIEVADEPRDGLRFPTDPLWVEGRDASIPWDPSRDTPSASAR